MISYCHIFVENQNSHNPMKQDNEFAVLFGRISDGESDSVMYPFRNPQKTGRNLTPKVVSCIENPLDRVSFDTEHYLTRMNTSTINSYKSGTTYDILYFFIWVKHLLTLRHSFEFKLHFSNACTYNLCYYVSSYILLFCVKNRTIRLNNYRELAHFGFFHCTERPLPSFCFFVFPMRTSALSIISYFVLGQTIGETILEIRTGVIRLLLQFRFNCGHMVQA